MSGTVSVLFITAFPVLKAVPGKISINKHVLNEGGKKGQEQGREG